MHINNMIVSILPLDLQKIIGRMVWKENIKDINDEFKTEYKVGISTLLQIRNGRLTKRKVFLYKNIDDNESSRIDIAFHEVAKNIKFIQELNGWERNPFNYRDLNVINQEGLNPGFMCIKNKDTNICILPKRYIYSKPMTNNIYEKYKSYIRKYSQLFKSTKSIRPGCT